MPTFNINGIYVEAENEEDAKRVASSLRMNDNAVYIRELNGNGHILSIPENGFVEVWTKHGDSIQYAGRIQGGVGNKILRAAIESIDVSRSDKAKLSNEIKKARIKRKHDDEQKVIDKFESTLPNVAKVLYSDVMNRMDANTIAYKLEIIDGLADKKVEQIKPHNWIPILTWMRDRILVSEEQLPTDKRRTFYQIRAAFVTAAARMVKDDVRNANTMKLVIEDGDHGDDFWNKYAQGKAGS